MKILIASDSFKNALSSAGVGRALRRGLEKILPDVEVRVMPMADGGEGTVEAVVEATNGRRVRLLVRDPLMREVEASFGITGDGKTAVIEMAAASGLQLLKMRERDPLLTSTCGTGELIRAGLDQGCKIILLGIGGSATVDGGTGMARALGFRFLDARGQEVREGGGALGEIRRIEGGGLDPRIRDADILVACDVSNPLTGPSGAAPVYGPQKGAGERMVERLDRDLAGFATLIREQLGKDVEDVPGAGAAGGLGAGLMAFLDAKLVNGFQVIAGMTGLENNILSADLVITGEGRLDYQTQFGKTPYGVAGMSRRNGKPVIAVAGSLGEGGNKIPDGVFDALLCLTDLTESQEESIRRTPELLEETGRNIGLKLKTGKWTFLHRSKQV